MPEQALIGLIGEPTEVGVSQLIVAGVTVSFDNGFLLKVHDLNQPEMAPWKQYLASGGYQTPEMVIFVFHQDKPRLGIVEGEEKASGESADYGEIFMIQDPENDRVYVVEGHGETPLSLYGNGTLRLNRLPGFSVGQARVKIVNEGGEIRIITRGY
ncbi:MAG: hypothetical protein U1C50_03000 [Patescibacteria group bacterium]|nr:hypothetical protein [Patescibacteria group bacterium]